MAGASRLVEQGRLKGIQIILTAQIEHLERSNNDYVLFFCKIKVEDAGEIFVHISDSEDADLLWPYHGTGMVHIRDSKDNGFLLGVSSVFKEQGDVI